MFLCAAAVPRVGAMVFEGSIVGFTVWVFTAWVIFCLALGCWVFFLRGVVSFVGVLIICFF